MKRILGLILATVLAMAVPSVAMAETLAGGSNWRVTFTQNERLEDNYSEQQWADEMGGLQPGDDITFTVALSHEHSTSADWYMANEVLKSLEAGVAQGSAYQYLLTYEGPSGSKTLYDSRVVGGDNTGGLMDATNALDEFFYLDTLSKGQKARVTLKVTLDGETEGNAYFDTLARLKMQFAVELNNTPGKRNETRTKLVKTGDDTRLFPFYVAMVVSGGLLLALSVQSIRERKMEREEAER